MYSELAGEAYRPGECQEKGDETADRQREDAGEADVPQRRPEGSGDDDEEDEYRERERDADGHSHLGVAGDPQRLHERGPPAGVGVDLDGQRSLRRILAHTRAWSHTAKIASIRGTDRVDAAGGSGFGAVSRRPSGDGTSDR